MTEYDIMNALGWDEFLKGDWTKTPPTKAGKYFVCDKYGNPDGYISVIWLRGDTNYVRLGVDGRQTRMGTDVWDCWWWSVPIPNLPPCSPYQRIDDESN